MTAERVERQRSPRLFEAGELPPILRDPSHPVPRKRFRPWHFGIKSVLLVIVVYVFVIPLIPRFQDAGHELLEIEPALLAVGVSLEIGAWFAYSMVARSALGEHAAQISRMRLFRIQMSTKALTNVVPAGSAAGPALGFRLLTLSGVRGADAGFALATSGIGSAVVLNSLLWFALAVSIPIRGFNPIYASAALAGVVVMLLAAGLVLGLVRGQSRAERIIRRIADRFHFDGDKATSAIRQVGTRVEELLDDRQMMRLVASWSAAFWLMDAAALWIFLRAFGTTLDPVTLLVAFGVANLVAAVPVTPGGIGTVDAWYFTFLTGFGVAAANASVSVASYRVAQFLFPILLGGFFYATLRIGPWRIKRRERLARLRTLAHEGEELTETQLDFLMRAWPKRMVRRMPDVDIPPRDHSEAQKSDVIVRLEDRVHRRATRDAEDA